MNGDYSLALTTIVRVMKVLKKMDDKHLLMEIQLLESKVLNRYFIYGLEYARYNVAVWFFFLQPI